MRRVLVSIAVIGCLSIIVAQSVKSQSEPTKTASSAGRPGAGGGQAQPAANRSADESAIRANIDLFVKAYNAGDAKAVAALFTPDGQIENKDGDITEGREAIAQTFAGLFSDSPKKKLEV